ncbi:MAG TPA: hypothetical protein VFC02_03745 [Anaerolineales bacterium]|jgi:hypothetical protein|nr:hypothetical protein [Anaerolineales bacterium]
MQKHETQEHDAGETASDNLEAKSRSLEIHRMEYRLLQKIGFSTSHKIVKNSIILKIATAIKGKTMAEPQETQQEKETRWAAQRAAHDTQQKDYRAVRARTRKKYWLVVGAIVIIVAVIAAAVLR